MSAKNWMKWLSVIALLIVGSSVLFEVWALFSGSTAHWESTELTALLLAIIAVIISFSKKK